MRDQLSWQMFALANCF